MDRGVLWAVVHGVVKGWTRLSACVHTQDAGCVFPPSSSGFLKHGYPFCL